MIMDTERARKHMSPTVRKNELICDDSQKSIFFGHTYTKTIIQLINYVILILECNRPIIPSIQMWLRSTLNGECLCVCVCPL